MTGQLEVYRLGFAIIGLLGLTVGLLGLTRGRPIILRSRWLRLAVLLVSVPQLLPIFLGWPARDPRLGGEVQLLTCLLVAGTFWMSLGGDVLLGVTPTALKEALIGTARLRAREALGQSRLDDVTAEMAAYFTAHPVRTNRTIYGYCIIGGTVLLAAALALSFAHPAGLP
jgi:hypothetical protein